MNESTTRPDCPVGPDESPTLVTWCDGCGAAGIRSDADLLDELCRYCGGDVKRRRFPSRMRPSGLSRAADGNNTQRHRTNPAARKGRVHDANALRAGLDAGVRRGG